MPPRPLSASVMMMPMLRRMLPVLSMLSLVLCVAAALLWVRSYWACDDLLFESPTGFLCLSNMQGEVLIDGGQWLDDMDMRTVRSGIVRRKWRVKSGEPTQIGPVACGARLFLELRIRLRTRNGTALARVSSRGPIPHWLAALLAAVLSALQLASHLQEPSALHGLCRCCGYDLRATPDRCPKCGTSLLGRKRSAFVQCTSSGGDSSVAGGGGEARRDSPRPTPAWRSLLRTMRLTTLS